MNYELKYYYIVYLDVQRSALGIRLIPKAEHELYDIAVDEAFIHSRKGLQVAREYAAKLAAKYGLIFRDSADRLYLS